MKQYNSVCLTLVLASLSSSLLAGEYNPTWTSNNNNTSGGFGTIGEDEGMYNTSFGGYSMSTVSTGQHNVAMGYQALHQAEASNNTAIGSEAMFEFSNGANNTAVGREALKGTDNWQHGSNNTAIGYQSNYKNTTGGGNASSGYRSLYSNSTGTYNTASGYQSLYSNTTGIINTGVGLNALFKNSNGSYNNALGYNALFNKATGSYNLALGHEAGKTLTSGNYNIYLNNNSGLAVESNTMRLGSPTLQTKTYISGIRGVSVSGGVPVYIDAAGKLGTVNSSARFKEDIQDMGTASDRLYDLRPVTYRYKDSPAEAKGQRDYGLIAEEVEKVYPDLVAYDEKGQIQTVQYQKLVPMLLNEMQVLNRKNQTQERLIQTQQQQINELHQLTVQVQSLKQTLADLQGKLPANQAQVLAAGSLVKTE